MSCSVLKPMAYESSSRFIKNSNKLSCSLAMWADWLISGLLVCIELYPILKFCVLKTCDAHSLNKMRPKSL